MRDGIAAALGMAAAAMARQADRMRAETAARATGPTKVANDGAGAAPSAKSDGAQFAEVATGLAMAALGRWMEKAAAPAADIPKPSPGRAKKA